MRQIRYKTCNTREELVQFANELLHSFVGDTIINITTEQNIVGETTHTIWYYHFEHQVPLTNHQSPSQS